MRPDRLVALALVALAVFVAAVITGRASAADVAVTERAGRDVATPTARAAMLAEQADGAWAGARWRARALYRLLVAGDALTPDTRARAIDAGARALGRELDEMRTLRAERDRMRAERDALAASARVDEGIGAPPPFSLPVTGAVLARFGIARDRATGVLVGRPGVRLAVLAGAVVRAPATGTIARLRSEAGGTTLVLDHGAGWTTIVGGLGSVAVGEGARIVAGQRLGAPAPGAAGVVTFEVWRGRRAVDPMLLVGPMAPVRSMAPVRPDAEALAASARLP